MSDDESRHEHLPTEGGQIFAENGSETVENDQTGLPLWAAALTAQMQTAFAGPVKAHPAELQELVEECRASAHDVRLAKAQLQDQRDEIEALQERMRVEAAERSTLTAEQAEPFLFTAIT